MTPRAGFGALALGLAASQGCFTPPKSLDSMTESRESERDSARTESVAADSEGGPTESGATADSTPDSAADGRPHWVYPEWTQVPPDPEWQAGDEVPGWPEVDCPDEIAPNVLTWGGLVAIDGYLFSSYSSERREYVFNLLYIGMQDCSMFSDVSFRGEECPDREGTHLPYFDVDAEVPYPSRNLMLGRYSSERSPRRTDVVGSGPLGKLISIRNQGKNARAETCLARVRPDNLRGVVHIHTRRHARGGPYDTIVHQVPLDILLPPGSGFIEHGEPDEPAYPQIRYADAYDYVTHWPWEDITDPAIRSALFWQYLPYDWPFPVDMP